MQYLIISMNSNGKINFSNCLENVLDVDEYFYIYDCTFK